MQGKHAKVKEQHQVKRHGAALLACGAIVAAGAIVLVVALLGPGMPDLKPVERAEQEAVATQNVSIEEPELAGWVPGEDGVCRYYDPETHAYFAGLLAEGSRSLYFDGSDGLPCEGWVEADEKVMRLEPDSRCDARTLLKDTWLTTDDGEYHIDKDGHATTGWLDLDGMRYYFDESGKRMTGWIDDGSGKIYWIRPEDGTMPSHEWIEMDGIFQAFDDDGSWVNAGDIVPPDDEEHIANMSWRQQAVVDACDVTPWPGKGLCAGWVSSVFVNAGEPAVGGDACDIARTWCTSDDLADLRPGMVIAVPRHERTENGRIWGHVCIYAGKGLVRDSGADSTRWLTLGTWFAWYGTLETPKWGWANGIDLSVG